MATSKITDHSSRLATKDQIILIEQKLAALEEKTMGRFEAVEKDIMIVKQELLAKIDTVEERLQRNISDVKYDLLKWMIPFFLTILGLIVTLILKAS